jgi:hypothetical protein
MKEDSRDTDDWMDALAGRNRPGMRPEIALDASLLRAAIQRLPEPAAPRFTQADEQRLQRALEQHAELRPEKRRCVACAERWRAIVRVLPRWPVAAVAGSAVFGLSLIAGLALWQKSNPITDLSPPPMRGQPESKVQVRVVAQPLESRNQAAAELTTLGAEVRRYERLGRFGLDAKFSGPLPEATQQALRRAGLTVTSQGEVKVEFESQTP